MQDFTYIGPSDIHDAVITSLNDSDGSVDVTLRSAEGREFIVCFRGVTDVKATEPVGMMLYGLTRSNEKPPFRFVFWNWEEEDPARLELMADECLFPE